MMRYRDGSKMDQVMIDLRVNIARVDALSRLLNSRNLPTAFACAKEGAGITWLAAD